MEPTLNIYVILGLFFNYCLNFLGHFWPFFDFLQYIDIILWMMLCKLNIVWILIGCTVQIE
jgi:hypothetical protein